MFLINLPLVCYSFYSFLFIDHYVLNSKTGFEHEMVENDIRSRDLTVYQDYMVIIFQTPSI